MNDIFSERHESHKQEYVEMWEGPHNLDFSRIDEYDDNVKVVFLVSKEGEQEEYPGFMAKRLMDREYPDDIQVKAYVVRSTIYSNFLMKYRGMGEDVVLIFYHGKLVSIINDRIRPDIENLLVRHITDCEENIETEYLVVKNNSKYSDKFKTEEKYVEEPWEE